MKKPAYFTFTLLALGLSLVTGGCSPGIPVKVHPAFYYWKTFYSLGEKDRVCFQSLGVERLYVRVFDLSWDPKSAQAYPSNEIAFPKSYWSPPVIIPVVYVTQEAVQNLREKDLNRLAGNILTEARRIVQKMGGTPPVEIQMDCDWTPSTRNQYFRLLEAMEKKKTAQSPGLAISATIRLHQVKYFRNTGVPPVEKGVLMVYHTSSPFALQDQSAIFDPREAKAYLARLDHYPLKLDLALPVFSWVAQFNRHDKFIRLLENPPAGELDRNPTLKRKSRYVYEAAGDTFLSDRRIMEGDLLKVDRPETRDILDMEKFLRKKMNSPEINLILFDYHGPVLKGGPYDAFDNDQKIFDF